MPVTIIIGSQWGDEGKGKIVDLLSQDADVVARYQGGANAGHTIVCNGRRTVLHLIPSGIFNPDCICLLGSGMVIDPVQLMDEIAMLQDIGITIKGRLFIGHRAHLVMPYHKLLDNLNERNRGDKAIGVTGKGIGPAYTDKYTRIGIRIADLFNRKTFRDKLEANIIAKNRIIHELHNEPKLDLDEIYDYYVKFDEKIDPMVKDISVYLNEAIDAGKNIICEGAQGTLLDVDWGTYPFVTSSNPTSGGALTGLGIGPTRIDKVLGLIKAYSTRVGEGPFPTEFHDDMDVLMRDAGDEFGATTGRARRCGWFDAVIARYSARINGVSKWALTKLDVLSEFDELKICTSYEYNGKRLKDFPVDLEVLTKVQPVYEEIIGWRQDISGIRNFNELPIAAKDYIKRIEQLTGTQVELISVGGERNQTIKV
ncbi:MAG: adenylosuccinate synthase [Candidatus Hatepunaea meridiana]|nr:adenylosuccinate synthase [Candidatus Hatepunaea meridiana]